MTRRNTNGRPAGGGTAMSAAQAFDHFLRVSENHQSEDDIERVLAGLPHLAHAVAHLIDGDSGGTYLGGPSDQSLYALVEAAGREEGRDGDALFDRSRMGSESAPSVDIIRVDPLNAVFKRGTTGIPSRDPRTGFVETDYADVGRPRMLDAFGRPRSRRGTASSSYDYLEEAITPGASDANLPAEKSEGAASNEMSLKYTEKNTPYQTVRATLPVTEEALDDNDGLRQLLDGRMRDAARWHAEKQMLSGSGSAPAVQGLTGLTGINTVTKRNTSGNRLTRSQFYTAIGELMGEIDAADGSPNMLAVNSNYFFSDILGATATDGQFIELPQHIRDIDMIVTTPLLGDGDTANDTVAILGDFATHGDIVVRKDAEVMAGWMADDFGKYQIRLRVVMRLCFVWYRPAAFGKLTRGADGQAD